VTTLETAQDRATKVARLITAAGPVFLKEAGEWEFGYQSEVRRRQRRDTEYRDPRAEAIEKARAIASEDGRKSAVATAINQLSQHAFDFITESDTVGDYYEEKPGDRLRWASQHKASDRRSDLLRRAALDLILAAAVRDRLTEAEFRLVFRPFESVLAFEALNLGPDGRYGPNTPQVEAFIEMIAGLGRDDLRELFRDYRSGKDSYSRGSYLITKAGVFRGLTDEVGEAQRDVRRIVDESKIHRGDWNQSNWLARVFSQESDRMHRFGHNRPRETSQRAVAALVIRDALTKKDFDWLFWPYQRRFLTSC
jgi:hypothetical protein